MQNQARARGFVECMRLFFRDRRVDLFVGYPGGRFTRLEQIDLREMGKNSGNTQMGNWALRWPEYRLMRWIHLELSDGK